MHNPGSSSTDEDGNLVDAKETPLFYEVVTPEQVIPRVHGTVRLFKPMIEEGFDPRGSAQRWQTARDGRSL